RKPPRQILKLDLGPMSRSRCSNQNFQIDRKTKVPNIMAGTSRKKTLDELKNEAIAELERRGYEARGKTPAQIRQMLRERRPKRKTTTKTRLKRLFRTANKLTKCGQLCAAIKKGRASFSLKDGGPKPVDYRPGPGDFRQGSRR